MIVNSNLKHDSKFTWQAEARVHGLRDPVLGQSSLSEEFLRWFSYTIIMATQENADSENTPNAQLDRGSRPATINDNSIMGYPTRATTPVLAPRLGAIYTAKFPLPQVSPHFVLS